MADHVVPVIFALFLWWFSTGAIIYLDGLPRRTFRWSLMALSGLLLLAILGLVETRNDTSVRGAYLAFTSGLIIWAWLEMAFYAGYITGPRKTPCEAGCKGPAHVWHAIETILYNQFACILAAFILVIVTYHAANQTALWTFVVLWVLQISAKLNVFLGVRNLNEDFLPDHMAHLRRYMTERPINLFFPLSVTVATLACAYLIQLAHAPAIGEGQAVGLALIATLLALAILEHWFLILPIPAEVLWNWGLSSRQTTRQQSGSGTSSIAQSDPSEEKYLQAERDGADHHNFASTVAGSVKSPGIMSLTTDCHYQPIANQLVKPAGRADWSLALGHRCDRSALEKLLTGIAGGTFGEFRHFCGVVEADSGYVEFFVSPGASHVAAYPTARRRPQSDDCRAWAFGPNLDQARLQAAFNACTARRIAT